jgi:hypothetical protein
MNSDHNDHSYVRGNPLFELWNSFWYPPQTVCPKCNSAAIEYYDPFFFSPIRTLKGKRRLRCCACKFVWRPNRKTKSIFDNLGPKF